MPRDLIFYVRELLGDRYKVEEEVAVGGAARVFRAKNAANTTVALKVLRPELMPSLTAKRFLREIEVLKQLDHPLIARLLDYGEADWFLYYVMDWAEGPTLRKYIDTNGPASLDAALKGSTEILEAVAHAHSRGIVHRDIKPENILLARRGAMLLDFGIARAIAASEAQRVTRSGFTVGTSSYMSPEQAQGLTVDERSDIYSLGCVLYETLTGQPPFNHPMESKVLELHMKAPVPRMSGARSDIPAGIRSAVMKALEKDPGQRWQSAAAMREALLASVR